MREGRQAVEEWGHTLLIGWTDRSSQFILQVCRANESNGGGCIVVLLTEGQKKAETEKGFYAQVHTKELRSTKIVFRRGSPMNVQDLRQVAADKARVIVILSIGQDPHRADANVLRVLMALAVVGQKADGHIVAEVRDPEMDTVIQLTGGNHLETLQSTDLLARMSLSAVKTPGVAEVFEELLGFEGDEFYVKKWPECAGLTYGALCHHFPDAIVVGIMDEDGTVTLCPPQSYLLSPSAAIIVIAEDDDCYNFVENPYVSDPGELPPHTEPTQRTTKLLVCGWGESLRGLLRMLNIVFEPGTEVHLCNKLPIDERKIYLQEFDIVGLHLKLIHHVGDPASWFCIRQLDLGQYRCALVISDARENDDLLGSDSHNLAIILLLRYYEEIKVIEIKSRAQEDGILGISSFDEDSGNHPKTLRKWNSAQRTTIFEPDFGQSNQSAKSKSIDVSGNVISRLPVFCEILDTRTQHLIEDHPTMSESSHFLVSNRLISKVLAMVSEDRAVRSILDQLLSGSTEITLVPSEVSTPIYRCH